MANYIKATNFAAKDSLPSGNAGKIIKGTEIDVEYNAIASAISSKADTNSPTFTGTPLAPTATAGTSNTQVATTAFVAAAASAFIPSGVIVMWSGSIASIPTGWVLCDGNNSTPNLRDRFVIAAGSSYAVAAQNSLSAKDAVVVAHSHSGSVSGTTGGAGGHSHNITLSSQTGGGVQPLGATNNSAGTGSTQAVGDHSHSFSGSFSTSSAGVSGTNANLPPYYALAYIMKA